jgi:hypothetical protein
MMFLADSLEVLRYCFLSSDSAVLMALVYSLLLLLFLCISMFVLLSGDSELMGTLWV